MTKSTRCRVARWAIVVAFSSMVFGWIDSDISAGRKIASHFKKPLTNLMNLRITADLVSTADDLHKSTVGSSQTVAIARASGSAASTPRVKAALSNPLSPDAQAEPADRESQPAEQVYKNIQVLKGIPKSQLDGAMNFIANSLGVNCNHCHLEGTKLGNWPWEADDKPAKQTARKMIQMVLDINRQTFNGSNAVNCYTCHKGQTKPLSMPVHGQMANAVVVSARPDEQMPSVDTILDSYVKALGGRQELEKLTTRVMRAKIVLANGLTVNMEIYQKAPNKSLVVTTNSASPNTASFDGFNGTTHWFANNRGDFEKNYFQLALVKRDAEFYKPLKFKELYTTVRVLGKAKVDDREVYVIEATSGDPNLERLYFDTVTRLLIRRYREFRTVLGSIPSQVDYEDYREVDNVKVPFILRSLSTSSETVLRFFEVKHNISIDDEKFEKPPGT
jgi:photosynthetic reaction center cytochrome c subunit